MSLQCVNGANPGTVVTLADGSPSCQDGMGNVVAWTYTPPFDITQLDYTQAGEAFAAAVVIVGTMWAIGKGARLIMDVVRR